MARTRSWIMSLALLAVPVTATGQTPSGLTLIDPTPTLGVNRCAEDEGYRSTFGTMYAQTLGLDADALEPMLEQLQDSLRLEVLHRPEDVGLQYLLAGVLAIEAEVDRGRSQVAASKDLHAQALVLLAIDPEHPGAIFFLGRLHHAVLAMGRVKRFIATRLLGARQFSGASWDEAQQLLEVAVAGDPCVADHHYELARLYAARGEARMARERLRQLLLLELSTSRDQVVNERARRLLERLRESS